MNDVSVFKYETKEVRTVDVEGETFWVAKDVCDILEIQNHRQAMNQLDPDEKGVCKTYTLGGYQDLVATLC